MSKTFVVILTLFVAGVVMEAQKPKPAGGGNTLFPVSAEFRCPMGPDCQLPDGIQGDSVGVYRGTVPSGSATTQEGQASNYGAYFTEGNLFLFVLKSGFGRFASFDFSQPTAAAPCMSNRSCKRDFTFATSDVSLPGGRTYPVDAMGSDLPNGFMSIPIGAASRARILLNFDDPSGRALLWTVRFDPTLHPGSSLLTVTRPSINTWTIEASASDVAGLSSATTSGKAVKVNEGYYRMPFKITVTK
jgi:hypothetical protein